MDNNACPAEELLKALSGKWKPQLFRLAVNGPLRFNTLLRQLPGTTKQSLSNALRELEVQHLLERNVICQKPLHVEYVLSARGSALIPLFLQLEQLGRHQAPGAAK